MKLKLKQSSPEWLEFRRTHLGASDAPAMLGISPYKTCFELWEEKMGIGTDLSPNQKCSMKKGHDLEPLIRQEFEARSGIIVEPACFVSQEIPYMMCSLDGISLDGEVFIEVKMNNAENHRVAGGGKPIDHHWIQMQHQWRVMKEHGAKQAFYVSWHMGDIKIIEVPYCEQQIKIILNNQSQFWEENILKKIPAELTERDHIPRTERELISNAYKSKEARELASYFDKVADYHKDLVVAGCESKNSKLGDLKLTKSERQGFVDYSKIEALQGMDLEPYRKPSTISWRIS